VAQAADEKKVAKILLEKTGRKDPKQQKAIKKKAAKQKVLNGKSAAPAWNFDWQKSSEALRRAQGKPIVPSKKEEKSIWQSVKEFFSF